MTVEDRTEQAADETGRDMHAGHQATRDILVLVDGHAPVRRLLELALAAADPQKGRVTALVVYTGSTEAESEAVARIEPVIRQFQDAGQPVELKTHNSGSISRGVLDMAREWQVDLLLLAIRRPVRGDVCLGKVAENVISAAPCPVLLFRPGAVKKMGRIVIPVWSDRSGQRGWPPAGLMLPASSLAITLGERLDKPAEALYMQGPEQATWEAQDQLEAALADLPGQEQVKRTIAPAEDATAGLVTRLDDDDLAVIALSERGEWAAGVGPTGVGSTQGGVALSLLKKWSGALLIVAAPVEAASGRGSLHRLRNWLTPTLTEFEKDEIEHSSEEAASVTLDYMVLITVSAILATLGLLLNSNAVIIGAMLVAPLMSPLIAFATGMTIGKLLLFRRAAVTLVVGVLGALLISFLIGVLSPTSIVTSEMSSRGNPTLLDMGVALASGFIGAYATARKHIPSALAGVAIAAALMPPLSTVGLAIAFGDEALAWGSGLLFLTNIVSIILAAWATFFWLGMRPKARTEEEARTTRTTSAVLVGAFALILAILLAQGSTLATTATIERVLRESMVQSDLVGFELRQGDPLQVLATVRRPATALRDNAEVIIADAALEEALDQAVDLSVVVEPVVDSAVARTNAEIEAMFDRILRESLQHSQLVDFAFTVGNPTIVIALVRTELDPDSEEFRADVKSTEAALQEASQLPIVLQVLVTQTGSGEEVASTNASLNKIIKETLDESLENSQLVTFSFRVGNPFVVNAVIVTELESGSEEFLAEVQAAENALTEALGLPVRLNVFVIPAVEPPPPAAPPAEEVRPTGPPELTPSPAPTEELPTQEPPTEEPPTEEPPTEQPPTGEPPTEEPPTEEPAATPTAEQTEEPLPTEEPPPTGEPEPTATPA